MTSPPRMARNLVWLALGDAVSRGGVFLYALLVARSLGPEAFGVFSLAQSTALYVWIGVDLGVNLYGAREIAKAGSGWRPVAAELFGLRLAASGVMAALYVMVTFLLAPRQAVAALVASTFYLVANALSLDWAAKGLERFHVTALGSAASAACALAGYFFLVADRPDPSVAVAVWGCAYAAGALVMLVGLRGGAGTVRPSFRPAPWRRHLSASLFFAASGALLSAIQYAPVLALTIRGGFEDLGGFSAAARIVTVIMSAGFLVPMAMYPLLSREAGEGSDALARRSRLLRNVMGLSGTLAGVLLFALAGPVVSLLYGAQYHASTLPLRLLALVVPLVFLRYSAGSVLLASGRQVAHSKASLVGLVVTAAACAAAVPRWGTVGASAAWIAGEAVVAVLMLWVAAGLRTGRHG